MKKLTYKYVKEYIESFDYKLLDLCYISAHTKMNMICNKGHKILIRWNDFQQGVRCKICDNERKIGRGKLDYNYICESIKKEGYKLLSKEYKNNIEPILVVCNKGHKFITCWKNWQSGNRCSICYNRYKRPIDLAKGRETISKNSKFYNKRNIPIYDTYAHQIEWCEEVRRNEEDPNILEVRCFKCNEWFIPKLGDINNRIQVLKENPNFRGEYHLYCSQECKYTCSVYSKKPETLMKEDAIRAGRLPWLELKREVQPKLRKMVIERDGYICQRCGSIENLECHHIYPVATNPLESADIDNCIMLCEDCHHKVHEKEGCRLIDLIEEVC